MDSKNYQSFEGILGCDLVISVEIPENAEPGIYDIVLKTPLEETIATIMCDAMYDVTALSVDDTNRLLDFLTKHFRAQYRGQELLQQILDEYGGEDTDTDDSL